MLFLIPSACAQDSPLVFLVTGFNITGVQVLFKYGSYSHGFIMFYFIAGSENGLGMTRPLSDPGRFFDSRVRN